MMDPDQRVAQAVALLGDGRKPEAVLLLNRLAAEGVAEAVRTLGELSWGGHIATDPVAARVLFERSDALGDAVSAIYVTNLVASGIAGLRNWPKAMARLMAEAERFPARREAAALIARMKLDDRGDPALPQTGERVSSKPDIVRYTALLTAAECDYVLKIAAPGYAASTVYDDQRRLVRDPIRTSDGSTLHWLIEDPAMHALNRRIAMVTSTGADQGEAAQVLRYRAGQEYRPHFDFIHAAANQREMTALVWLNDNYKGGETVFPKVGLKFKGRKGDAVVFRNALAGGTIDPLTEHAGTPVTKGAKYVYSRWIRTARWQP